MNTEGYVQAHEMQKRDAIDVIEEFSEEIGRMHGHCLDIGCGPSIITRNLIMPRLPLDAVVTGGDVSKEMIDFAKQKHADEKRLSFSELDIEAEKLPSSVLEAYDNAISFYCLHWCQNIRRVFDNIYQILRPGGKSLVLFLASNSGFDAYLNIAKDHKYKPYMQDVAKYIPYFQQSDNPRATLKKIIEESHLEVTHCSYREKTFIFENLDILKKHVRAVNPFMRRMPEEMREQYLDDLLREIVSKKFSYTSNESGSKDDLKVLDRYHVLIAYFKKPID